MAVVEAALDWFMETQVKAERVFTPAEEKLRVAVMMYRKTRSISGQLDVTEVRRATSKTSDKE